MPFTDLTLMSKQNKYSPLEGLAKIAHQSKGLIRGTYDFAVSGGAVGAINLKDDEGNDLKLPSGLIVHRTYIDGKTVPTSGGAATLAVGTGQAANDVKAAAAIAGYTGLVEGISDGAMANAIKLTAERQATVTVAVAALTAGKIYVYFECAQSV